MQTFPTPPQHHQITTPTVLDVHHVNSMATGNKKRSMNEMVLGVSRLKWPLARSVASGLPDNLVRCKGTVCEARELN